jgi:hypothetical protein
LGRFWEILAILGSFGQIRVDSASLTVDDSIPQLGLKPWTLITFEPWVQMLRVASHWKATIHIYNLKKIQKIQKFISFTTACPKSLNFIYGTHRHLGVNLLSMYSVKPCVCKRILKGGYYFLWLYFRHPYIYINFQKAIIKMEV